MIKAVVFDLGGTLMEYKGMPLNWGEYYYRGFQNVNQLNELRLTEEEILKATNIICNSAVLTYVLLIVAGVLPIAGFIISFLVRKK